jgi:hypothetical protein
VVIASLDDHRAIVVLNVNRPRRGIVMVMVLNLVWMMTVGATARVPATVIGQRNPNTENQDQRGNR